MGAVVSAIFGMAEELRRADRPATGQRSLLPWDSTTSSHLRRATGGLRRGAAAVPQAGAPDRRVASAIQDSAPVVLLTHLRGGGRRQQVRQPCVRWTDTEVIEVDTLDTAVTRIFDTSDYSGTARHICSTPPVQPATPVGAIVSHHNIRPQCAANNRGLLHGIAQLPESTFVSWLPFYHDMGLMLGVTAPLMAQSRVVLTSPLAFLSRPASWLQLMASHSGAFSAAPNFALDFAVRCVSDDDMAASTGRLGGPHRRAERVNCAPSGASPVNSVSSAFARTLVRPAYGLAEATLHVATPAFGRPVQTARFDRRGSAKASPGQARSRAGTTSW